ncbi:hypothetical protein Q5P01_007532 [Channa striata]|uniref:Uncharacterized protein n=1 Tax=Channa striata TaxID=64152 RepID=A0AA88N8I4_CHASR|nr:hypothetical protein Q5P01_007532 [Channa striata]
MRIKSAPSAKKKKKEEEEEEEEEKKKKKKKWAVQRRAEAARLGWEGAGGRKTHLAEDCAPLRHSAAPRHNWEPLRKSFAQHHVLPFWCSSESDL